LREFEEKK
jgi:hypothetical protein